MTWIKPVLKPAAQEFADATANPPQLYDLPVAEGRKMVDSVQDGDIQAPPVDITGLMIPGGPSGEVSIKIFRPQGAHGVLPALLFTHGAGWVFGDAHTHGRLVAELARSTRSLSGSPPAAPSNSWTRPGSRSRSRSRGTRLAET
jgi:acetyl esterase